jgi:hypothetical protein
VDNQALAAFDQRANNFFLFVDNAEEAIDPTGQLLPYLNELLMAFTRSRIRSHIVLATTRVPEYSADIAGETDFLHLDTLADEFVREAIDLLLEGSPRHGTVMASPELGELIEAIGGHPLAAKMVSALLKSSTPEQIAPRCSYSAHPIAFG